MNDRLKKLTAAALIGSVMCMGMTSCGEQEDIPDIGKAYNLTMTNETNMDITMFKIKDSDDEKYSENKIRSGQSFNKDSQVEYVLEATDDSNDYSIQVTLGDDKSYVLHKVPVEEVSDFSICYSKADDLAYITYLDSDENEISSLQDEVKIKADEIKAKKEAEEKAKKEKEEQERLEKERIEKERAAANNSSGKSNHKKGKKSKSKHGGCIDNPEDLLD